ncbi:hypothetical protein ACC795_36520, partial [Rhizobium ruizarguesonis]
MLSKLIVIAIVSPALLLTACSRPEPLQTSTVAPVAGLADIGEFNGCHDCTSNGSAQDFTAPAVRPAMM